jgi:hypothetical protein
MGVDSTCWEFMYDNDELLDECGRSRSLMMMTIPLHLPYWRTSSINRARRRIVDPPGVHATSKRWFDKSYSYCGSLGDYFATPGMYPPKYFRGMFLMNRGLFMRIVQVVEAHDDYFKLRSNAVSLVCATALRRWLHLSLCLHMVFQVVVLMNIPW